MALIVFLALKNTPLAFLTAYSYERLNILHQAAGYCTVFSGLLHAVVSLATLSQANALKIMLLRPQVMGIVAGFTLLIILTTALTLRKRYYEVFYGVHVIMFMLIMISLGLHRPYLGLKAVYVFIFTACIWALDRLYRIVKISSLALGNTATINPLPHGGVRVVVRRTPWRAVSGSHVFLWVPKIRAVETHPFTIVSTNPLELVISAHDGFTKDLLSFASENPGAVLRASCDGPYGTLPNFSKFDHVVLVAGGSGASFTFGTALSLIRKMDKLTKKPVIHFIWIIREYGEQLLSFALLLKSNNN
jgi:predicted ferric reductase